MDLSSPPSPGEEREECRPNGIGWETPPFSALGLVSLQVKGRQVGRGWIPLPLDTWKGHSEAIPFHLTSVPETPCGFIAPAAGLPVSRRVMTLTQPRLACKDAPLQTPPWETPAPLGGDPPPLGRSGTTIPGDRRSAGSRAMREVG